MSLKILIPKAQDGSFFPKMGQTTESMISFQCVMKYKEDVEKKWEKQILLQTEKYANTRYNT